MTVRNAERRRGGPALDPADLLALLPILDAVAKGPDGDRVERWARAMCADAGVDPDGSYSPSDAPWWTNYISRAEQGIALADAEMEIYKASRIRNVPRRPIVLSED